MWWVNYTPNRQQPFTVWYREPWPSNEAVVVAFCRDEREVNAALLALAFEGFNGQGE